MENKMADKTVTTCASVLYALFQKRQRKCSCLCHTNKNKNKTKLHVAELNADMFFHCKCSLECHALKLHCPKCGKAKYRVENKRKKRKKKILKFQIEHTASNVNLTSPKTKNNLLCTCELKPKCSPSLSHIINNKPSFHLYSPKTSPGKFSLQDLKSTSKGNGYSHPKQLAANRLSCDLRPKSFYEWSIPYANIEFGEKVAESPKGPVHRGRWHGDVMIYMRSNESKLEEFLDEVSLLGMIRHENVVLFMGASIQPPNLAVVTSVRKGQTLYNHLHIKQTSFHFGSKFSIAKQVAQGMGYLQAKGIILGKLCSRNVFLEAKVKIGITEYATSTQPTVKSGCGFLPDGHLSYLCPELMKTLRLNGIYCLTDKPVTSKADVYAYGTLLYEIFLGRHPFKGIEAQTLIWKVSRGHVASVDATDFPLVFKGLIQSCWHKNADKRPEFQEIINNMRKFNIPRSLQNKLSLSDSGAINKEQQQLRHQNAFQMHNLPARQTRWKKTSNLK